MDDGKVPVGRISLPSFLRYLGGEGESKKLNFRIPDPKYLRLFCVNLQKEFLLDKVSDELGKSIGNNGKGRRNAERSLRGGGRTLRRYMNMLTALTGIGECQRECRFIWL